MSERYVDPNSGAAMQPGGFAAVAPVKSTEAPEEPTVEEPTAEPAAEEPEEPAAEEPAEEPSEEQVDAESTDSEEKAVARPRSKKRA